MQFDFDFGTWGVMGVTPEQIKFPPRPCAECATGYGQHHGKAGRRKKRKRGKRRRG